MSDEDRPKTRGRPPAFNKQDVLDIAMRVFWKYGYEGTSLSDLTDAMGINRPSLYAAFGNKQRLFYAVIEHYLKGPMAYLQEALTAPTTQSVIEHLFRSAVDQLTREETPAGCLLVHGALSGNDETEEVRDTLIRYRTMFETLLRKRFETALQEGEFPSDTDVANLAKYVTSMHQGLCVQACSGNARSDLTHVATLFCESWPKVVMTARRPSNNQQINLEAQSRSR